MEYEEPNAVVLPSAVLAIEHADKLALQVEGDDLRDSECVSGRRVDVHTLLRTRISMVACPKMFLKPSNYSVA